MAVELNDRFSIALHKGQVQCAKLSPSCFLEVVFWLTWLMATRFASKSWSCSELIRGAAAVVDAMDGMTTEQQVAQQKRDLLNETSGMETGQLEALLQDSVAEPLILSIFMPAELNARP